MELKFLIDNQLPLELARYLRERGIAATHVRECALDKTDDGPIAAYARQGAWVIITKDEDFVMLSNLHGAPQVVWIRLGNCRNQSLLAAFDRCLHDLTAALAGGQRVIAIT